MKNNLKTQCAFVICCFLGVATVLFAAETAPGNPPVQNTEGDAVPVVVAVAETLVAEPTPKVTPAPQTQTLPPAAPVATPENTVVNTENLVVQCDCPCHKCPKCGCIRQISMKKVSVPTANKVESAPQATAPAVSAPEQEKTEMVWYTSYQTAVEKAKELNRPILVDFTGSDWCGWCIKLNKEVFSQAAFQTYAKDHLVMLEVDFPRTKAITPEQRQANKNLSEKYGVRGYPTILLIDAEGKVLGRTGYREGGAEAYVKHLQTLLNQ